MQSDSATLLPVLFDSRLIWRLYAIELHTKGPPANLVFDVYVHLPQKMTRLMLLPHFLSGPQGCMGHPFHVCCHAKVAADQNSSFPQPLA